MKKNQILCLVLFFLFYVLWLFKGDEWLGLETHPVGQAGGVEYADDGRELEAGMRFAWQLGY